MISGVTQADDGVHLYYEIYPPANSKINNGVIIFQHGYTSSGKNYSYMIPYFVQENYQSVVLDGRGSGRSGKNCPPASYNIHQYAEDVISVANHLNLKSFSYVGHSMGGGIGLILITGKHAPRIEKLILLASIPSRGVYDPQNTHEVSRRARKCLTFEEYSRVEREYLARQETIQADLTHWNDTLLNCLLCEDSYYDNTWQSMMSLKIAPELLKQARIPTLVLAGNCDSLLNANLRDYTLLGDYATLHVFSRVAHEPNKEIPKELAFIILDFLRHGASNPTTLMQQVANKRKEINESLKSKL